MKKRSRGPMLTLLAVILAAALLAGAIFSLGIPAGLRVSRLLSELLTRQELDAHISLQMDQGLNAELSLFRRQSGDKTVTGCTTSGITLFYAENRLIFDNGQAYDLEDVISLDVSRISQLLKMLPVAGVRRENREDSTGYILEPDADTLASMIPDLSGLESLRAEITEQSEALRRIAVQIRYQGADYAVTMDILDRQERTIPQEVWSAVRAADIPSIRVLEPLGKALMKLAQQDTLVAQLRVNADCGPVNLSDTMMLYGTHSGVYLERKGKLEQLEEFRMSAEAMLGLGYEFFRSGQATQVDTAGSYTLLIPAEQVREFCISMVPEIAEFPITYEDGSVLLEVVDETLNWIRLDCSGDMPFLITTIPISLGVELTPISGEGVILPDGIR